MGENSICEVLPPSEQSQYLQTSVNLLQANSHRAGSMGMCENSHRLEMCWTGKLLSTSQICFKPERSGCGIDYM